MLAKRLLACASTSCIRLRLRLIESPQYKKLSYRRVTARSVVSVEILPIATQQYSTTNPEQIEVMKLEG